MSDNEKMDNNELSERIKDIKLQEGATYAFIGGMTFILIATVFGIVPNANIIDAILCGAAASVASMAFSALTIGKYFKKQKDKITYMTLNEQIINKEEKSISENLEKTKVVANTLEDYKVKYIIDGDLITLMDFYGVKVDDVRAVTYLSRLIGSLKKALNEDMPNATYWQMYYYELLAQLYEENHAISLKRKL